MLEAPDLSEFAGERQRCNRGDAAESLQEWNGFLIPRLGRFMVDDRLEASDLGFVVVDEIDIGVEDHLAGGLEPDTASHSQNFWDQFEPPP